MQGTTTCENGIVGWLMEAADNGTFDRAAEIIGRGIAILRKVED